MFKKVSNIPLLMFCILLLCFNNSCKDEEEKEAENYFSAKNNSYAENVFADIFKWVNDAQLNMENELFNAAKGINTTENDLKNNVIITLSPMDTTTWPKMLTINFGPNNVMCLDGKKRKGKISAAITGRFNNPGTVITIIPSNYYINDFYTEGTLKIICAGFTGSGNILFREDVKEAKVATPDGTIYWECDRDRELISGKETPWPNIYDDVYKITGSSWGTDVTGRIYETNIVNPLKYNMNCKWVKEGSLEITPEGISVRSVDYGDDGCNPHASVTIADKTYNFVMAW